MMKARDLHSLLLVEDSPSMAMVYQEYIKGEPQWQVSHCKEGHAALVYLHQHTPDLVLLDLQLPDMHGLEILKAIHEQQLPTQVVIITAHGSVDTAVEATRLGAFDYLEKPFSANRLLVTMGNALRQKNLSLEVQAYRDSFDRDHYHGFIGASPTMQALYQTIESAAPSSATIFITGESGTGKEVCAEAIHKASTRRNRPFIPVNCAAIPKDLMESELFGHVKGSFTGALSDRQGAAQRAHHGTLFLDEIGELPLDLQSKLLRFLQTGQVQKVGAQKGEVVDVRILCATNRDPWEEVQEGRFREDLYYRLNVIPLHLPPLRKRDQDVLLLAHHLLQQYSREEKKGFTRFSGEAEQLILGHRWPGNVRELQNVIRHAVVLNDGTLLEAAMLPPPVGGSMGRHMTVPPQNKMLLQEGATDDEILPLWVEEKRIIERALKQCGDNIPQAAARLQINPSTIYRKKQLWKSREEEA
ncbi:two component, sigma54 specific, transcriptional regulator, Fis family [Magnetococcus marinus MC-1]|uniref:Two component, sigma54 specific, transcriptional regulator, Fis family n=1 Tax=Magnetococcus marinus (strain ATCC BAA-1437 / JCM 17883 / MC-1) TaxID=156889 RepID=A0L4H3_MAGMM|nr:sigma-54 dependent transcriptional regulator [Magnetococcus marinus]ABK42866.1 two component, sigma54 specific, transcriptional regulator, Fis family [Magnetococcus marinus MC-1]